MRNLLALLVFLLASCGFESSKDFIINGQKCLESEFPSSVEIWVDAFVDMPSFGIRQISGPICGGTLIAPDLVLTAAHCFKQEILTDGMGELVRARYGVTDSSDLRPFKKKRPALSEIVWGTGWKQHEDYSPNLKIKSGLGQVNDIALLYLSKSLWLKPTQVLAPSEKDFLRVGTSVHIVGWGSQTIDSEEENPETTLNKMCAVTSINQLADFEMQIGAGGTSARKCFGDSGGATYLQLPTGEYRLIGVTSHAYDQSACQNGGVDTRVDVYHDWIMLNLKS